MRVHWGRIHAAPYLHSVDVISRNGAADRIVRGRVAKVAFSHQRVRLHILFLKNSVGKSLLCATNSAK